MDEKAYYIEHLATQIDALEHAGKALQEKSGEAVDSIRRLAHTLYGSGSTYGFPEISEAAMAIEAAGEEEFPRHLENLIATIRNVTASAETEKFRILVIDDDPVICRMLKTKLSGPGREIVIAESSAAAMRIVEHEALSLIILDLILPDMDGRNLLTRLREYPWTAEIPIFILSARVGDQIKTECLALGADEYFEKPFDPEILSAAVAARLQHTAKILHESRRDSLTGIWNRYAFKEAFERERALAIRGKFPLSLAILDIDYFKRVNDTYGHAVGDEVLCRVASLISKSLRGYDIIARWGGEEFVLLLPNTGQYRADRVLERLLAAIRSEYFQTKDGRTFKVTFSSGVVEVSESLTVTVDESVARADHFLYLAKAAGRNRIFSADNKIAPPIKTVLLAEDDDSIASVVKLNLLRQGFEVIHFRDGAEALSAALNIPVSLFILDVNMPGMNGFELLEHLRSIPSFNDVPIVMLTVMGSEKDIVSGFELGADDYIVKPFSLAELLVRINRLLMSKLQDQRPYAEGVSLIGESVLSSRIMKILLVDDDPDILRIASMALEKIGGYQVIKTESGQEAIERAKEERPDVVLMDVMMPDLDGPALIKRLRADEETRMIPVIFLTAKSSASDIKQLISFGAKGVITKPFDPLKLSEEVERLMESEK